MLSVTLTDKSGRTLSGQELEAFYYSIEYAKPLSVGINCAMGISEMKSHIIELSDLASCYISVHANAGMPNALGGYNDTPEFMAKGYLDLAKNGYVNICGGCCGTTPEHIRAMAQLASGHTPRPVPPKEKRLKVSGLEVVTMDPLNNFTNIGERTNVAGSRKFARLVAEDSYRVTQQTMEIIN